MARYSAALTRCQPASVFLFTNNKMRNNPNLNLRRAVAFVQQEPNFTRMNQDTTYFWTKLP